MGEAMTYTVWFNGQFITRFVTRDGALGWIISQPDYHAEYEITDESDDL